MQQSATNLRLLCIDDDAAFVEVLSRQLSLSNITVIHAFDAIQGFRLAAAERPDLIITDYCMPYRFGSHLLRQLRNDPDLSLIPVIVVTGRDIHGQSCRNGDPVQAKLLQDLGAENVLRKPLDWKLLYDTIEACTATRPVATGHPALTTDIITGMTCAADITADGATRHSQATNCK